jgi:hypothetical protein
MVKRKEGWSAGTWRDLSDERLTEEVIRERGGAHRGGVDAGHPVVSKKVVEGNF